VLVFREGVRPPLKVAMDYLIAGIAAALLFGYLITALLRPERF
jgi:K+-transporting ATPase KdpF subunit